MRRFDGHDGGGTEPGMARLLIVDDDALTTQAFSRLLTGYGYDVVAVASADEAFRSLADASVDAILLDLRMPFINGLGFLYRLRSQPLLERTPVVVVTGDIALSEEERLEIANLGAELHFKPIQVPQLVATLVRLIGHRKAAPQALADDPAFPEFHRDRGVD